MSKVVGAERNGATLGEEEDVALGRLDLFAAGVVLDVEVAVEDDLHLVIRVLVHERRALFQTVEAARERGIALVAARRSQSVRE